MSNGNGTIYKMLATASAVTVLGLLFFYFMQWHFARDDQLMEVIQENTKATQENVGVSKEVIKTLERLDDTINSQRGQANLRSLNEELVALPSNVVSKQFEVIYDRSNPNVNSIKLSTTTAH